MKITAVSNQVNTNKMQNTNNENLNFGSKLFIKGVPVKDVFIYSNGATNGMIYCRGEQLGNGFFNVIARFENIQKRINHILNDGFDDIYEIKDYGVSGLKNRNQKTQNPPFFINVDCIKNDTVLYRGQLTGSSVGLDLPLLEECLKKLTPDFKG